MMTSSQLTKYCERLGLKENAVELLNFIRNSEPARSVQGGYGNVVGRYPSRKMGRTIQFESRTNELPRVILFENDPNVLEFWDQPPPLKLSYQVNKVDHTKGIEPVGLRNFSGPCVIDFFLLEHSGCGWAECKPEDELKRIAEKSTRYVLKDGIWRCPPGEEVARNYGFFFKVLSSKGINPTLVNNLGYLEDYFNVNAPPVEEAIRRVVLKTVKENPGILLSELKNACPKAGQDDFNSLIASGDLYVDLTEVVLNQPENVRVFRDATLGTILKYVDQCPKVDSEAVLREIYEGAELKMGEKVLTVTVVLNSELVLRDSGGKEALIAKESLSQLIAKKEISILSSPPHRTPKDLEAFLSKYTDGERTTGLHRFAIYSNRDDFEKVKPRTRERWRKRVREAEARWGASYGWVGLLPTYHNGGRRPVELSPDVTKVLESAFAHWKTSAAITFSAFWKLCVHKAHETHTSQMCCKKTAKRWLNERRSRETTLIRDGKAVLNSTEPPLPVNDDFPPFATRPWERVFIDHTMADIRLRLDTDTLEGKTMRPYLSVMVDQYSRKVLAFVLDFDPPSRDTCMHLVRECVRLHHYLPGKFSMDNGKEFKSIYFQRLLSACWITPEYRPPKKAKFGAPVERFFGNANTDMFHQMLGNTKAMKNPRQVTKQVNPETTAVWTLETLYDAVSEFCFITLNNLVHPTFGSTPNERFEAGIKRHGHRPGRSREYDDSFKMLTFPTTPHGKLTVGRNGIRMFGGFSFWAQGMERALGEKVAVCYNSEDVSQVFVFLNKHWIPARAGSHHLLEKLSRRALHIATKEFFIEQKRKGESEKLNEVAMGKFLESIKCREAMALQKQIDAQFRAIEDRKAGQNKSETASDILPEFDGTEPKSLSLQPPTAVPKLVSPKPVESTNGNSPSNQRSLEPPGPLPAGEIQRQE